MIGPHYQKIAEVENKLNARQLLHKIQSRSQSNPLNQIVDKLRRQFSEYQTAYSDQIVDHQIHSVDRLLSFDGKLGPILNGLEKENNLLRKQLSVLQNQLSNTVSICEQILNENNELKQIIKRKNLDIQKIIETIALNESQERGSLQDKISLLQQENSILIRHLDQIRKQHQSYNQQFAHEQQQINNWKRKFEQTKKHLTQVLEQEQELSRKLSLLQHNLYNQTEKFYNLQAENQALAFQNNQIKNQLIIFKSDHKSNTIDALKTKLEEQYAGILQQHKVLKKDKSQLLRESQIAKIQRDQALEKLMNMEKIIFKLQKDLELTQTLLSQQKQKNAGLQSNISRMESRFDQMKAENSKVKLQLQSTNNYALNKEKNLNRQITQLREELDKKSIDMQRGLRDLREKTRVLMEAKESEIKSLNDTNIEFRRLLQKQPNYSRQK